MDSLTITDRFASTTLANDDERWVAIVRRDPSADGQFFYSVSTTRVFCRPSCPSRLAGRNKVRFHTSIADAQSAGFRPCKRCKPDQPPLAQQHATIIAKACRIIETAEALPNLDTLAQMSNVSRYHFHRMFKAITGATPKAYGNAHRAKRVREALSNDNSVTSAIYEAGFNSNGRFYETSKQTLGMTPTKFRTGGANITIRFAVGECSLGAILVAATDKGVCAILLDDDPDFLVRDLQDRFPRAELIGGDAQFEKIVAQVIGFIEAPALGLDLPLDVRGTIFQQRVWQALRDIPPGTTASYSEIAQRIESPKSVRAVATACAANTIAVAIPCHRVVRIDGALSGYRWGIERKRALLDLEKVVDKNTMKS